MGRSVNRFVSRKRAGGRQKGLPPAASWLGRELLSGVVDGVVAGEDQLRDGDKGIAFLDQAFDDGGKGLRRVFRGIMEENDGAWLDLGGDAAADFSGRQVLPVQTITAGSTFKAVETQRRTVTHEG